MIWTQLQTKVEHIRTCVKNTHLQDFDIVSKCACVTHGVYSVYTHFRTDVSTQHIWETFCACVPMIRLGKLSSMCRRQDKERKRVRGREWKRMANECSYYLYTSYYFSYQLKTHERIVFLHLLFLLPLHLYFDYYLFLLSFLLLCPWRCVWAFTVSLFRAKRAPNN